MKTVCVPVLAAAFWLSFAPSSLLAQDPLASWGQRTAPGVTADLYAIAYGNGVFVAVGDQSTVIRSTNGTDWATVSIGNYGHLRRVRFLNGQFWAVGTSDKLLSSSNGTDWQASTLPTTNFWDIAAGPGVYLLAGNLTFVSSNLMDWVRTFPMLPRVALPTYETPLDTIVYGSGVFFAIATGGPSPIASARRQPLITTDGINWTVLPNPRSGSRPTLIHPQQAMRS